MIKKMLMSVIVMMGLSLPQLSHAAAKYSPMTADQQFETVKDKISSIRFHPTQEGRDKAFQEIRDLVLAGIDPALPQTRTESFKYSGGETLLHLAAGNGNAELVEFFLNNGFKVVIDEKSVAQETPLYVAAEGGHAAVVQVLVAQGALVNTYISYNQTALFCAASKGHREVVRILLDAGADPEITPTIYRAPIDVAKDQEIKDLIQAAIDKKHAQRLQEFFDALGSKNFEQVQTIIAGGLNPKILDAGVQLLAAAIDSQNVEIIQALLATDLRAQINAATQDGLPLLHRAYNVPNQGVFEALVACPGININCVDKEGASLLEKALVENSFDRAAILVDAGASVNTIDASGVTLLHKFCTQSNKTAISFLLDKGADSTTRNAQGKFPFQLLALTVDVDLNCRLTDNFINTLTDAIKDKKVDAVRKIVAGGLPDEILGHIQDGKNVLHVAVVRGNAEIVELLLQAGFNNLVNFETSEGQTALALWGEMYDSNPEVGRILLAAGANPNIKNEHGWSLLAGCVIHKRTEKFNVLMAAENIDVDVANQYGQNALSFAAGQGNVEMVQALLHAGARLDIEYFEETPLDVAREKGHQAVVTLLEQATAQRAQQKIDDLCAAISAGNVAQIQELLSDNTVVDCTKKNSHGRSLLDYARQTNDQKVWDCIGGNVFSQLFQAICDQDVRLVLTIVADKLDENISSRILSSGNLKGCSLLHVAAIYGNNEIVEFLLASGLKMHIDLADAENKTALHRWAEKGKDPRVGSTLILAGARSDVEMDFTDSVLHYCVRKGKMEFVKNLIAAGVDVNKANKFEKTPLSIAVSSNNHEMVALLIAAGADATKAETEFSFFLSDVVTPAKTPLESAREKLESARASEKDSEEAQKLAQVVAVLEKATANPATSQPKSAAPKPTTQEEVAEKLKALNEEAGQLLHGPQFSAVRKMFRAAWIATFLGSGGKGVHEFNKIKKAIINENKAAAEKDTNVALITDQKELNTLAGKELWRRHKLLVATFVGSVLSGCIDLIMPR